MLCYRELGHLFTWELTFRENHKLVTSGPYSYVRHPSYTGTALITLGSILLFTSRGSYYTEAGLRDTWIGMTAAYSISGCLMLMTFMLCARAPQEDAMLRQEFGEQWEQWAKRTPWRVVPYIF